MLRTRRPLLGDVCALSLNSFNAAAVASRPDYASVALIYIYFAWSISTKRLAPATAPCYNGLAACYIFYSNGQRRLTAASRIQFSIPPARSYRGFASSGASADRGLSRAPHSSQPGQLDRHNVWLSSKQWLAARRPTLLIRSLHP